MKQKIPALVLLLTAVMLLLTGCIPYDPSQAYNPDRDFVSVEYLVSDNWQAIRDYIEDGDFSRPPEIEGIRNVYCNYAGGDDSRRINCVSFACGGAGFASATRYFGFCYVPDDDYHRLPYTEYVKDDEIIENGDRYVYQEKDGDNEWIAEKITDGFWFYHMSF